MSEETPIAKGNPYSQRKPVSVAAALLRAFISLSIIGAGCGLATWFIFNPAHTKKTTQHQVKKVYVTTTPVLYGDFPVKIDVMGKVSPAREVALKAQVSGEVISVSDHFVPGGFVDAGEEILKIDPADYELAVKTKHAALKQAEAAYRIEEGQQKIARNEIEILKKNSTSAFKSTDLALRKPQLAQAKANIESAQSALEIAELDLKRTALNAPFNAIITARNTNIGNVIAAQSQLATLVSTDEYWINVDVPLDDLVWLNFADEMAEKSGSEAVIMLGDLRGERHGEVFRQTGTVDDQSRLAGIIIRVKNPLLLEQTSADQSADSEPASKQTAASATLVLGDYVPVTLTGKTLVNTVLIPQQFIRQSAENDAVWLEEDGKLAIRAVKIAYKDRNYAYVIQGIEHNAHLITSNIITPVEGMDITVQNAPSNTKYREEKE